MSTLSNDALEFGSKHWRDLMVVPEQLLHNVEKAEKYLKYGRSAQVLLEPVSGPRLYSWTFPTTTFVLQLPRLLAIHN